jgi:hypothetical protein
VCLWPPLRAGTAQFIDAIHEGGGISVETSGTSADSTRKVVIPVAMMHFLTAVYFNISEYEPDTT